MKTLRLHLLFLVTFVSAIEHSALGIEPDGARLPSSVKEETLDSGAHRYTINGMYDGNWTDRDNWVAHAMRAKYFFSSDSLHVDCNGRIGTIVTARSGADLPDLIDWLAHYTPVMPTWQELVLRDSDVLGADPVLYVELARRQLDRSLTLFRRTAEARGPVTFSFFERLSADPQVAVWNLRLHMGPAGDIKMEFAVQDTVAKQAVSEEATRLRGHLLADCEIGGGRGVVARLNDTSTHCKCHMNQALRVFDIKGRVIWKTEAGIWGQQGLWCHDFDNDGRDEIAVLTDDHGRPGIVVYGSRR